MPSLLPLYNCPYCPRTGVGQVSIDPDAAIRLAEAGRGMIEVIVSDGDPEGVLVFDPDGRKGQPCAHVISLLVDVEVGPRRPCAEFTPLAYTGNFDHPGFAADARGELLSEHLWIEVNGGEETAFHPSSPFEILFPNEELKAGRKRWEIRISGTVFLAMEPETFMAQLRETYLAQQAFRERESA